MAKITVTRRTLEKIIALTTITKFVYSGGNYYSCDLPFINNPHYVREIKGRYFINTIHTTSYSTVQDCLYSYFSSNASDRDIYVKD